MIFALKKVANFIYFIYDVLIKLNAAKNIVFAANKTEKKMITFFNLLSDGASSSNSNVNNPWTSALVWILLGVLLIGLFVFNWFTRKKQQKAAEEKMNALKVGDRIKTIGLICGTIVSTDEIQNTVVISTGDDDHPSFLTIDKSAIYQVFPAGSGVNGVNPIAQEPDSSVMSELDETDKAIDEIVKAEVLAGDDEKKDEE